MAISPQFFTNVDCKFSMDAKVSLENYSAKVINKSVVQKV